MGPFKSYDKELILISTLLSDVQTLHGNVFDHKALKLTLRKVSSRFHYEGISFLTKTLPRLGKALDKALSESTPLNSVDLGFKPQPRSCLPKFLGEFFNRVLSPDGMVLHDPCISSIRVLQDILYCFYKYEIPYTPEQEQAVLSKFEKTEEDINDTDLNLYHIGIDSGSVATSHRGNLTAATNPEIARRAKQLLTELFASFDPTDIKPRHGPGAVATRQRLWDKFRWVNVSYKIRSHYPLEEYFVSSWGHALHQCSVLSEITGETLPARVVLVPKDSRGPRLISCEPVDFQWIQQGLSRAIVSLVESHPLTQGRVNFTNQQPNQFGALLGSESGKYATLDLNEASDRVSVALVHLLFPDNIFCYLDACRTSATELPDARVINLNKFAPMGSALCFPVLALTIWALLSAGCSDGYTRERILVYGDDVIVPTAYAANAMTILEAFGLRINRDKSCTKGFFRESCGVNAFKGVNVTPVRFRTVWNDTPSAEVYASWIEYSNELYRRKYYKAYDLIVGWLHRVYGAIPSKDMVGKSCPALIEIPDSWKERIPRRTNKSLQRLEYRVRTVVTPPIRREIDGWSMLSRYFSESTPAADLSDEWNQGVVNPFSVRMYTERRCSVLHWAWR